MKNFSLCAAILLTSCFAVGQATPTLTPEQKNVLYSAQHKLDGVQKERSTLDSQVQQISAQLKQKLTDITQREATAKTEMEAAQKEAFKTAGVDEKKFDLDLDSMTFKEKPSKAEAAPPNPTPKDAPK